MRLLYVACTRARDHLVVSLHRREGVGSLSAELVAHGAGEAAPELTALGAATSRRMVRREVAAPPSWDDWLAQVTAAQATTNHNPARAPPAWKAPTRGGARRASGRGPGVAKGARDLELPPWSKGRYGTAIGRAVHGVLQTVDLATGAGLDGAVGGVRRRGRAARDRARVGARAVGAGFRAGAAGCRRPHWRESCLGTVRDDGTVLEGFVDLIYREDDGSLVIVDYKTDAVPGAALDVRVEVYRPQIKAYADMLGAAVGGES